MKIRDMENAFKYRRLPYPKRSVELIALLAISCTFFLFMHTSRLNNRLREMEIKLQPSEFSALGITGGHFNGDHDLSKPGDINSLHGTYQYLKSTGQKGHKYEYVVVDSNDDDDVEEEGVLEENSDEEVEESIEPEDYDYDELSAYALNNTRKAEIDVVLFNRVPKVGSQSLMELMNSLQGINGFISTRDTFNGYEQVTMNEKQQKEFADEVYSLDRPLTYSKHVAHINFTQHNLPRPIYINLVRDPIERVISWHYYVRARWYYDDMKRTLGNKAPTPPSEEFLDMDLDTCVRTNNKYCQFIQGQEGSPVGDHRSQSLFFCGHELKVCMPFNSEETLQRSKRNVEEDYAVVGSWEDTNITLTVFENYIPRFFRHAKVAYYLKHDRLGKVNKNPTKKGISAETREILRRNFTREIEFYEFCKQRLYLQYAALNKFKRDPRDDAYLVKNGKI